MDHVNTSLATVDRQEMVMGLPSIQESADVCEACMLNKQHCITFPMNTTNVENGNSKGELEESDKLNPRKRSFGIGGNKACREKKRRDKLNDRFMDLSAVLDPEKPPKSDKGAILSDAVRAVSLLRVEAEQLKDLNDQLRDAINGLKAEKNELRDEKLRLKVDKARLEQKMEAVAWSVANKNMGMQGGFHQDMAMLPWLPSMALLDTSEDHILHPPVA